MRRRSLADVPLRAHGYEDQAVAEFENVLVQSGNSLALEEDWAMPT